MCCYHLTLSPQDTQAREGPSHVLSDLRLKIFRAAGSNSCTVGCESRTSKPRHEQRCMVHGHAATLRLLSCSVHACLFHLLVLVPSCFPAQLNKARNLGVHAGKCSGHSRTVPASGPLDITHLLFCRATWAG